MRPFVRRSYSKPPYVANLAARKFLGDQEMGAVNSEDRKKNKYTYFSYRHRTPHVSRIAVSPNRWSLSSYLMTSASSLDSLGKMGLWK